MKTKVIIIVVVVIAAACFTGWGHKKHNPPISVILTTTEWVEIPVNGKNWGAEVIAIDGVVPKYKVSVNNKKNPIELPKESRYGLGEMKSIRKVYFILVPGQGIETTELRFQWK